GPRQHGVVQEIDKFFDFRRSLFPLDTDVNVFRVLAEYDYVELVRMLHRRRHALVIAHRANTGVKIEDLAQGNVEGTNTAAYGRSQWSFDGDMEVANGVTRRLRQPVTELGKCLFAGKDFKPVDLTFAAISAFHSTVKHSYGSCPDVTAGAVAFNIGNDGIVWNLQLAPAERDRAAARGQ